MSAGPDIAAPGAVSAPRHTPRLPGLLLAGAGLVLAFVLLALVAPWLAPHDPLAHNLPMRLQPPSWAHPFGTDMFGRDILSRVIHATRIDLQIAVIGVALPFVIGTVLGTVSGFLGGLVDTLFMRLVDVVMAFPFLVLVLAIMVILGPGLTSFFTAVAMVGWVSYARLVRAQVLVLRGAEFVLAARSLGYSRARIMLNHLLPNALGPSVVFAMSDAVLILLLGASVSYLGLGVQPPAAEWGVMVAEGQSFLTTAWWMALFPGLAIVALALGFSLMGDGLADLTGGRR